MTKFHPPRVRPPTEAAGYLGYYTRVHVDLAFDLVDIDGAVPVVWWYHKAETTTLRLIEEKPGKQEIHDSQNRLLRRVVRRYPDLGAYVIYEAERLVQPDFPIRLERIGCEKSEDRAEHFDRTRFDKWLLDGLMAPPVRVVEPLPPCDTWARLTALTKAPFTAPADLPSGVSWYEIDDALKQLAMAMEPF